MPSTGETLTLMMGDHVTFPKGRRAAMKQQPSEASSSYFPSASHSPTSSSSSPLSSSSNSDSEDSSPLTRAAAAASPMVGLHYPIPPLERQYRAPTEELDVARQLAKKPLPRSLHSSLRRAAARKPLVEDDETRARKLAAAKKELLALAGQI
ncbi:DNA topoisomerase [Hypoxylon texense]